MSLSQSNTLTGRLHGMLLTWAMHSLARHLHDVIILRFLHIPHWGTQMETKFGALMKNGMWQLVLPIPRVKSQRFQVGIQS